jgi:hypothetical protein
VLNFEENPDFAVVPFNPNVVADVCKALKNLEPCIYAVNWITKLDLTPKLFLVQTSDNDYSRVTIEQ